ncbi:hypothetical protein DPSP01_013753 [Paraphaeosphaeria sporulosa]
MERIEKLKIAIEKRRQKFAMLATFWSGRREYLGESAEGSFQPRLHRHNDMPVPLPSTNDKSSDKSTSSVSSQTTQDVEKSSTQSVASATHTEKTEAEMQAERLYEERMEEEYAKREGGA